MLETPFWRPRCKNSASRLEPLTSSMAGISPSQHTSVNSSYYDCSPEITWLAPPCPGGQAHGGSCSVPARNHLWVCVFQRGKTDLACRELALKPVPITMFLLAHPPCRFCYIRDVQGLLQHTKLLLCRLPVAQTIFSSMDKIVVAFVRFCSGNQGCEYTLRHCNGT